jgi:hypothetical protein
MTKIRFYSFIRIPMPGLFPCLCGAITELFFAIGPSDVGVDLVGSTFNIQNFIPHKSQKPKAMAEINRPIEFQRGTVGATESAKEGTRVLTEGSDIGLGCRGWVFKSPHSDQNPSEINDFRGIFLFFVYCGAEFESTFTKLLMQMVNGSKIIFFELLTRRGSNDIIRLN